VLIGGLTFIIMGQSPKNLLLTICVGEHNVSTQIILRLLPSARMSYVGMHQPLFKHDKPTAFTDTC